MGNDSSPPPGLPSPSPSPAPPRLPSPPSSSTVPFSWEKQPGVPKPRLQQQPPQKHPQKVEKSATFLPLRPPPAPLGGSGRSTPNSCNSIRSHAPSSGHACRKKHHHHHAGQHQHVHLSKLFPVVDVGRCQTKVAADNPGGADDPFSLALARCVEEARRPVTAPFKLPSPTPPRRSSRTAPSAAATAAAATTWGSSASKTKNSRSRTSGAANATGRLSSAFRPLDLYGSCRSSGVSCGSSVVQSTVSIRRRSTSDVADYYSHGRHNRQYVAYGILYGRHR